MQKKLVTKKTTALKKKRKVSAHSKTKLKNLSQNFNFGAKIFISKNSISIF